MDIQLHSCLARLRPCSQLIGALVVLLFWGNSLSAQQPVFRTPQQASPVTFRNVSHERDAIRPVTFESSTSQDVLMEGRDLESRDLWADALNLYQQAIKKDPQNNQLKERRSVARIHFDLDRRYSDASFLDTIRTTGRGKALNVYAEVLLKIQHYYVDEPNWARLANFGLSSLEVALSKQSFRQSNLKSVTYAQAKQAFENAVEKIQSRRVNTRHDVHAVAALVATDLETQIGLPSQASIYEFVCGAITALDPYSAFMSGHQYTETMSQIEGNFVGLGVELRTHQDRLEIVNVIRGGSADRGGIQSGDSILAVNNQDVSTVGAERAADMLRGELGSFVELRIRRGGKLSNANLQRRRVEIPSVDQVRIVDQENGVGYVRLTNFQKTTVRDFDKALWDLHRRGMRSLIVDLRGNPGGLLTASVEVADRFVDRGVIVSTRGRNPMEDYTHQAQTGNTWKMPLVVLIDENSASASEIFAAAIRDHRRGTIVGQQSYGKGSVQGIFPLNVSGGGVRLTTAKFYSPLGRAISQVGVNADVKVQTVAKPAEVKTSQENEADPGLRIGIQVALRATNGARTEQVVAGR